MKTEIYLDSRTKEQWEQVTKNIPKGFACVELCESGAKIKIGDGSKTYVQLPYLSESDLSEYYTKTEADALLEKRLKSDEKLILNCELGDA